MKTIAVIGVGLGDPEQLTRQAVEAMNRVDVFLVWEKGSAADELAARRRSLCERFATSRPYRFVHLDVPQRQRQHDSYTAGVDEWTAARAALLVAALHQEVADGQCAGILAWGDPAFYDSTLRILRAVEPGSGLQLRIEVIPGISAIQALAAAHQISLTDVGQPLHLTTGRRLAAEGFPAHTDNVVVMLDGQAAFRSIDPTGLWIYWGANLGTDRPALIAGPLEAVAGDIVEARAATRAQRGWIMDTYLLRRIVSGTTA